MKKYALLLPDIYREVVNGERRSREFLRILRFPRRVVICPLCRKDIPDAFQSRISRYWCRNCHYRFFDFSKTLLASNKLPWSKVITAAHLFILGKSAHQTAGILNINYKSAHSLFSKMRLAILLFHSMPKKHQIGLGRKGKVYLKPGFARYLKGRIESYRHPSPKNRLLYLKEQEFKYDPENKSEALTKLLRYLLNPLK
ncbi:MAG: hypothetical protein V1701_10955 [Planctomycetota bacterium]